MKRQLVDFARLATAGALLSLSVHAQWPELQRGWVTEFGSVMHPGQRETHCAPDGAGGMLIGGTTWGILAGTTFGSADAFVGRVDGAGNRIWLRQFGTRTSDFLHAIAEDGAGGAFLAGQTDGSLGGTSQGRYDAWLARIDASGQELWTRQLGTSETDQADEVAWDGASGLFVGGTTYGSLGAANAGRTDAWLAAYDLDGNLRWILQLGTTGYDATSFVASDGAGGLFAGGNTEDGLVLPGATGSGPLWLAHLDAAGNALWIRQLTVMGPPPESLMAGTPDGAGGLFLAGIYEAFDPYYGPVDNTWVSHLDASGNALWSMGFDPPIGVAWAQALAVDGSGGVFVGGYRPGLDSDPWLARCDAAGTLSWFRTYGSEDQDERVEGAIPDGAGGVLVSGVWGPDYYEADVWLARMDGAGDELWDVRIAASGTDIDGVRAAAPDGAGGVFAVGATESSLFGQSAGGADLWLTRADADGELLWTSQLGTPANEYADVAASDDAGGFFVGGSTAGELGGPSAGGIDVWLARHDGDGTQLWIRQLGTSAEDRVDALAPDGAGGVLVAGTTPGALGGPALGEGDVWLARYDAAGVQLWILQGGTPADDAVHALAADGVGGFVVGGETRGVLSGASAGGADGWLARYDGSGKRLWTRQLGTAEDDAVTALFVDGAQRLYVGGTTAGSLFAQSLGLVDAWVARYELDARRLWNVQLGTNGDDTVRAVAADERSGVYIGGEISGIGTSSDQTDAWIARFTPWGRRTALSYLRTSAPEDAILTLVPLAEGGVVAGGRDDDAFLIRFDPVTLAWAEDYGRWVNPFDSLTVLEGAPVIGTTVVLGVDNPLGTQSAGSVPFLAFALDPDPAYPKGTLILGFGMSGGAGEILLGLAPGQLLEPVLVGPLWQGPGQPARFPIAVPPDPGLLGLTLFAQGALLDLQPTVVRLGLTRGLEIRIGEEPGS